MKLEGVAICILIPQDIGIVVASFEDVEPVLNLPPADDDYGFQVLQITRRLAHFVTVYGKRDLVLI